MSTSPELPHLHIYAMTFSSPHKAPYILQAVDLPKLPPARHLRYLHLALSGARAHIPPDFLSHYSTQLDLGALTSLSLLNLLLQPAQLEALLAACPGLVELFISSSDPQILYASGLERMTLEVFHLTGMEEVPPKLAELVGLAERVPTLKQVGVGNRVYEVYRGRGYVELGRWSRTDIPRYFQIWRG